jgi:Flp pilus assembly protein TadG
MFKILNRFRRDERGAAYIMTALSIVPLAGMTALAVDYVIADRNKTEIQTSVETVALYLAKRIALDPNLDASALIDEGKSILDATTDLDIGYDEFTVDPVTGKVRLAAFTMQDTYFMHMFGHEHLKVGAKAEARFGRTDIEVAIAMDVSGSMNTATTVSDGSGGTTSSTRIKDARTAAKKLVASASGNVADIENADIKFSIVPWHSTVVVGTEFENAWWVDWDGKSTGHYRYLPPFKKNAGNQTGDMYFNVPAAYQYSDSSSADEIVSWTPHMVDEVFPASVRNPEPMPGINTTALNNLPNIGVVTRREVFDMFSNVQWAGCFEHRHGDYMFSSAKPDSLIGDSLFIPYMAPDERGQSSQENWSTSNNGEPVSPISSRIAGSSMVAGIFQSSPSAIFCMVPRRILPERVLGRRFTVSAILKAATGPISSRTSLTTSFRSPRSDRLTPELSTMKPAGNWPFSCVGDADDGAFGDVGMPAMTSSMPPVDRRWPATLMMSSVRAMMKR